MTQSYYNNRQASEKIGIALNTLFSWIKCGWIHRIQIENRWVHTDLEIEKAIVKWRERIAVRGWHREV